MQSPKTVATLFIFGGAAVGIYVFWRTRKNSEMVPQIKNQEEIELKWESVGKVAKVFVYPVKSCKAISAQTAEANRLGLLHKGVRDRSFIIVSEKGTPVTGRMAPTTVLIQTTFEDNILTLNFPGSEELQVDISHAFLQSLYADFTAYMLMTTESIADLQSRVPSRIAAEDFRPNIVVEGTQKPYDEDEWQCIKIGGAIFRNVVPLRPV